MRVAVWIISAASSEKPSRLAEGAGSQLRRTGGACAHVPQELPSGAVIGIQQLHRSLPVGLVPAVLLEVVQAPHKHLAEQPLQRNKEVARASGAEHTSGN